jgi:hypothetical protein
MTGRLPRERRKRCVTARWMDPRASHSDGNEPWRCTAAVGIAVDGLRQAPVETAAGRCYVGGAGRHPKRSGRRQRRPVIREQAITAARAIGRTWGRRALRFGGGHDHTRATCAADDGGRHGLRGSKRTRNDRRKAAEDQPEQGQPGQAQEQPAARSHRRADACVASPPPRSFGLHTMRETTTTSDMAEELCIAPAHDARSDARHGRNRAVREVQGGQC